MSIIKYSRLLSSLHASDSFDQRNQEFLDSINSKIHNELIYSELKDYDCDLKLIFVESGGSEMLLLNAIKDLKEPFYLLTSGDNNSLAASLEILTYLNNNNLKGEIIHGDIDYIASRINELVSNKKISLIEGQRFGVIGKPSDWLISSIPSYKDIEDKYGIKLIDISLDEIINNFDNEEDEIIHTSCFNELEIAKANKVYKLLKKIVEKYSLNGLTIRCFDLLNTIHTTGCLGLAKLNSEGIIGTCEGDIMAMISMAIAKAISSNSSFQANPSRIDTTNNTILFAHCTIPLDMLDSYKYKTHFESGIGVAIKGELKLQTVTVLRLSSDLKHYFVSKGTILENKEYENLCRTQIIVKLEKDVRNLLNNPCGNHHIIFYGDYEDKINKLFK